MLNRAASGQIAPWIRYAYFSVCLFTFLLFYSVSFAQNKTGFSKAKQTSVASSSNENARNLILSEKINDAIAAYAQLIPKDSTNSTLIAEYAYALALGGIFDAALVRLDHIWNIGANSTAVNYFTSQIFALMGYDDLADGFWKASEKFVQPPWIAANSSILLQKYKRKYPASAITNREELKANFRLANELAAQNLYFQSITMFHEIINQYHNDYLPYVGYSIALEKIWAFDLSALAMGKAISLIGDNPEHTATKQLLEKRLVLLSQKSASFPKDAVPGLPQRLAANVKRPQMMAYAGGMITSSASYLNGRFGYYISEAGNASLDLGIMSTSGTTTSNLGLSVYSRQKILVVGTGIQATLGNGGATYYWKISVGVSIMNKSKTSSFDVFLDGNMPLAKGNPTTTVFSVGKSIYFGQRK